MALIFLFFNKRTCGRSVQIGEKQPILVGAQRGEPKSPTPVPIVRNTALGGSVQQP